MSAVATILGLLLVVTFIANYLATTLPQDMSVNDVNHDLLVENQVGRLSALMAAASEKGAVGVQLTQPVVLGSEGLPPFAEPDAGSIGPAAAGSQMSVQIALSGTTTGSIRVVSSGGAFAVSLRNTYAPAAEVAYDYGAVVFAQPAGIPTMIDAAPISLVNGALTIWVPIFSNTVASEGGTGAAIVAVQFTALSSQTFPSGGITLGAKGVTLKVTTPYSAGWVSYFASQSGLAAYATCSPSSSSECSPTGPFNVDGSSGTVELSLPSSAITSVTLEVATFTISVS